MKTTTDRHELHLHTKLSDDVSVIGVREAFDAAQALGLRSVAFTNLGNVSDFPEIMRWDKEYADILTIYGAQLPYRRDNAVYHLTLLAKSTAGIKALYKVISSVRDGAMDLQVLREQRRHLLVGSCGMKGELYDCMIADSVPEHVRTLYDYFELVPSDNDVARFVQKKIYELGEELGVPVVAVSNCHYLHKADKVCCNVVKVAQQKTLSSASEHLRTTEELLDAFAYLGEDGAAKVVFENPSLLVQHISPAVPLKAGLYFPVFENAREELELACNERARELYGDPLPDVVKDRLDAEFAQLQNDTYAPYMLAVLIPKYAQEHRRRTTVRGAGSVLISYLIGISDINPLPPHYRCSCGFFELSTLARDGYDLPRISCPHCGKTLQGDGHDLPYQTFMGLTGDKMPDFDINVPCEFMAQTQAFLKEKFGEHRVVRAGTVGTLQECLARAYIDEYERTINVRFDAAETEHILRKIVGTKRHAGLHPGGLMILPSDMEIEDFTPLNHLNDTHTATQLDFHSLHGSLLKQDVLGHHALDRLEELERRTEQCAEEVAWNDPAVFDLLRRGDTDGIVEFEHDFLKMLLTTLQPQTFYELVKISALAHGCDVWRDNAEWLLHNNVCTLEETIASRDDILLYLTERGMDTPTAYTIMETARKGRWAREKLSDEDKARFVGAMQAVGVPDWYIECLSKIRYMFVKGHAVAYVRLALQLAWFKVHYPDEFRAVCEQ